MEKCNKKRVAVSSCLLGRDCRYNGETKFNRIVSDVITKEFDIVEICPEDPVFGTPREAIHLKLLDGKLRVFGNKTNKEYTKELVSWCEDRVELLKEENISGYIFKARSPSCAVNSIDYFDKDGNSIQIGSGVFAKMVQENFDFIIVDEGYLTKNLDKFINDVNSFK